VLSLAIGQVTARPFQSDYNRRLSAATVEQAVTEGARVVLLPELIVPGYALDKNAITAHAERLDGPTVRSWIDLAIRHKILIAGGFAETDQGGLYNSAVLVGPEGVLLHYRKLHPFDAEKTIFAPGDKGLTVARTSIGMVGLCVCYDLRFVEVVRALALQGADLILVPTAWVASFDRQSWDSEGYCPQARGVLLQANLSQVFIVCASQAGSNGSVDLLGSSLIADPFGKTVSGPLPGTRDALAVASIDLSDTQRSRERSQFIRPRADRRTDVYGISIGGRVL
jgi:N-carbamoylputrescine amidase